MKKTKVHHLKTWIEYFEEIFMDRKRLCSNLNRIIKQIFNQNQKT